jgi:hypothetical protein
MAAISHVRPSQRIAKDTLPLEAMCDGLELLGTAGNGTLSFMFKTIYIECSLMSVFPIATVQCDRYGIIDA